MINKRYLGRKEDKRIELYRRNSVEHRMIKMARKRKQRDVIKKKINPI